MTTHDWCIQRSSRANGRGLLPGNRKGTGHGPQISERERSGAIEYIECLQAKERKAHTGPKTIVPLRAVFIAMVINNYWGDGSTYTKLAETFELQFTTEQREALGINVADPAKQDWYNALHRTMGRALKVLDPWYKTSKRRKLTEAEYAEAHRIKDRSRKELANNVLAMLLRQSVELLPKKYLENYHGHVALDATMATVGKRPNAPGKGLFQNVDFTAGIYGRARGHYNEYDFGFEIDTAVMVDAYKGQWAFNLITAAYVHKPGKIKKAGLSCINQHNLFFSTPGIVLVDRAYNNLEPHNFQEPIRKLGYETAYKYKKNGHGFQARVDGQPVILVDGNLYLDTMPEHLRQLHHYKANNAPLPSGECLTPELFKQYMSERSKYRLKRHGGPNPDAYQRFKMPKNIEQLDHRDFATGAPTVPPVESCKSFTLAPTPLVVKHIQKPEYESPEWKMLTGQRNHVENSNRSLKRSTGVAIGDSSKRLGRGKTFQTLAIAFALVAENLRRIIAGIKKVHEETAPSTKPKTRARRRKNMDGTPAAHHTELGPLMSGAPPGRNT